MRGHGPCLGLRQPRRQGAARFSGAPAFIDLGRDGAEGEAEALQQLAAGGGSGSEDEVHGAGPGGPGKCDNAMKSLEFLLTRAGDHTIMRALCRNRG